MEKFSNLEWIVKDFMNRRSKKIEEESRKKFIAEETVQRSVKKFTDKDVNIPEMVAWVQKVTKYVPVSSEKELEELIHIMIKLSIKRSELHELYDKPGLNLMKKVRETMIKYHVVLTEYRSKSNEFLPYWFTDDYWLTEWSQVILDLPINGTMERYGFPSVSVKSFLTLLIYELACADSASKLEKPMLQILIKGNQTLIIPTKVAAEEYDLQIDRIKRGDTTFTEWVKDTLKSYQLPK